MKLENKDEFLGTSFTIKASFDKFEDNYNKLTSRLLKCNLRLDNEWFSTNLLLVKT